MENNNEEMDLIALIRWFGNVVKGVFLTCVNFCGCMLKLCYRNKIKMILFIILGVAIGLYLSFPKVYQGEYIITSNYVNADCIKRLLDGFDETSYCVERDMAKDLCTSPKEASTIKNVKSYYVLEDKKTGSIVSVVYKKKIVIPDTNTIVSPTKVCVRLYLKDMYTLTDFYDRQFNFFHFLRNNQMVLDKGKIELETHNRMLATINNEIQKLDSLSKVDYFKTDAKRTRTEVNIDSTGVTLGEKDKRLYHDDMLRLAAKRDSLETLIKQTNDIAGIEDISPILVKKHPSNYWLKNVILFGVFFFFVGLFFSAFWENRKRIKQYLEEK